MKNLILIISMTICLFSCHSGKEKQNLDNNSYRYLALGDSYTIGESVVENGRWPVQLRDSLIARGASFDDFKIIAKTGWRTDDLSKAMDQAQLENTYNLVSLLIGVNNQYQGKSVEDYKPEFEALLNRAVALAGGKKSNVFVVSIPDYAYTSFGQTRDSDKISKELKIYNDACKRITIDNDIKHIDITPISFGGIEDSTLVAGDGLHPSSIQYTRWVRMILAENF